MTIIRMLTVLGLALGGIAGPAIAQISVAEQQDARVIDSLSRSGADLSKPHDIDFFLMFSREPDASAAATAVEELGYKIVAVEASPDRTQWQVHAKRNIAPALEAMTAITRRLETLAQVHGGYYDGWGTVPVE